MPSGDMDVLHLPVTSWRPQVLKVTVRDGHAQLLAYNERMELWVVLVEEGSLDSLVREALDKYPEPR